MARAPRVPQDGPSIFDFDAPPPPAPPTSSRLLIVEADGGSRGNPGPAAYGALVRDESEVVLDSEGLTLGIATNNFAEYSGLIAALEMARAIDADAEVAVRMDSKLVIEQSAGRWKIKHPDLKPLAQRVQALRPAQVSWTWIPREQNKAADALVNAALDGKPKTRSTGR
jgi:ribonuclease HI